MSLSALTGAMALAAATIPGGPAQPSLPSLVSELVALDQGTTDTTSTTDTPEAPTPLLVAQSAAPAPEAAALTSQPTEPETATDPASTVQPETENPALQGDQSDIVIIGRRPSPEDPLEDINAASYDVAQTVDKSFVAPIAFAYAEVMPRPVRKGLRNFLRNLGEPAVFVNYLMQLKPGKAAETLGRFAINSTLGAGGLVDVAKRKPFNLPYRRNGFANTLGFYGVKPGPYFYLPLVGPTTLRDFIGGRLDLFLLPSVVGNKFQDPKIVTSIWVLSELGRRIEMEEELNQIRVSRDPYLTARTHYLQRRQAEIDALRGRKPSTTKDEAPAPVSGDPVPPPASQVPVQDPATEPRPVGQ